MKDFVRQDIEDSLSGEIESLAKNCSQNTSEPKLVTEEVNVKEG